MSCQATAFCFNVNISDIKELNCVPFSSTKSLRSHFHRISTSNSNQRNVGLARCARGNVIQFWPSQPLLRMLIAAAPFKEASDSSPFRTCKVKRNDDAEGNLSGESIILDEEILKRQLQIAIEEEDYAQAARIRDNLRMIDEDTKTSVLAANARFYESFKNGNLATMQTLWAKGDNVCCVHPGASGISGYDSVMESWELVWMNYEFPLAIELKDVHVHVRGNIGYVTCIEFVRTKGSSWGGQFATNVFERIDDQWYICIHHASPVDL